MEPLSTTTALASIIGLIGQFKTGRDSVKSQSFEEFMQWLAESNHVELKALIEANHTTTISIKAILKTQTNMLTEALQRIDAALASFTSTLEGFTELAVSLHPNDVLSEQAIGILRGLSVLDTGKMLLHHSRGVQLIPIGRTVGKAARITVTEQRFIEDDLKTLVSLGLLNYTTQGTAYTLTRKGFELVKTIPSPI